MYFIWILRCWFQHIYFSVCSALILLEFNLPVSWKYAFQNIFGLLAFFSFITASADCQYRNKFLFSLPMCIQLLFWIRNEGEPMTKQSRQALVHPSQWVVSEFMWDGFSCLQEFLAFCGICIVWVTILNSELLNLCKILDFFFFSDGQFLLSLQRSLWCPHFPEQPPSSAKKQNLHFGCPRHPAPALYVTNINSSCGFDGYWKFHSYCFKRDSWPTWVLCSFHCTKTTISFSKQWHE